MKHTNHRNILKGVSTLDIMKNNFKAILFLVILMAFSANVFGGHSTLDVVDPNFNPQIQTGAYNAKWVNDIYALPDGKLLAFGAFNTYNRVAVGNLVRLNADGSIDLTFNNQTVTGSQIMSGNSRILVQPDGKIILKGYGLIANGEPAKQMIRLNADGSLDSTFNFAPTEFLPFVVMDSLGRLTLMGTLTTPQGTKNIIRLNADGSFDNSFNFTLPSGRTVQKIAAQGSRLIVHTTSNDVNGGKIYRLNENGTEDTSFTPMTAGVSLGEVQPDNKILYSSLDYSLLRANENGGDDSTFLTSYVPEGIPGARIKFTGDGKIVTTNGAIFRRYSANGGVDPSFTPYTTSKFASYTIQSNDNIVIGDSNSAPTGANNFIRLTSAGAVDPTFNVGGRGFQTVSPGKIGAIDPRPDGKVLLGGNFDLINDVVRTKLARLNADSTIDYSFQINTTATGNYFSAIRDVYQIRTQPDGKIIISGSFDYLLNGDPRYNLARLNSDGSIDPTFNLNQYIPNYYESTAGGQNRFEILSDGKFIVGTSKINNQDIPTPLRLTSGGARDTTFNPAFPNPASTMFIDDVVVQPDGKIIFSGTYSPTSGGTKSFLARLNADGSTDSTFLYSEEPNRVRARLALLPNGKILFGKFAGIGGSASLRRLNSDGSVDNSFNTLTFPNSTAKINALLVLPTGKIFVGGVFTVSVTNPSRNLVQLDENGNIEPTVYTLDNEVLCLAADNEGRVLIGGGFTIVNANGAGVTRSYVARLTDSQALFDFDGDGKSDLGLFNGADGLWTIRSSETNQIGWTRFGLSGDKSVTADYDGDGKADIAVFRPSEGVWYLLRSRDGFGAVQWGLSGDKPVAGDFDGDGKADIAIFRPSEGIWYVLQSSNLQSFAVRFGVAGDIPLAQTDFDGDGKTDIAIWRPSDGNFYWLPTSAPGQYRVVHFGASGDIPAPADYNGDGKTDLAVFRPAEGNWYQYLTTPSGEYIFGVIHFGLSGDVPVAADYDGDGKTDIAVRRQNEWHILRSTQGYSLSVFGIESHTAVAAMPVP